jgi:hypothetical protein
MTTHLQLLDERNVTYYLRTLTLGEGTSGRELPRIGEKKLSLARERAGRRKLEGTGEGGKSLGGLQGNHFGEALATRPSQTSH